MKINGEDIETYGAKQYRVDVGMTELENDSEWTRGSPLPFLTPNTAGFKEINISLIVYGNGRENIKHRISRILKHMLVPVTIEPDGWEHKFYGILEKSETKEYSDLSRKRFQVLELSFQGYEYSDEVTTSVSNAASITVNNPGTAVSPIEIELTPTLGAASITLTGVCRDSETGTDLPVAIKNLVTGKTILLDGITGLITQDGELKSADVDMWELPSVLPGNNTIHFGTDKANVTVKILPIYI